MTKLLKQALEEVQKLPPESQDEIARAMLMLAGNGTAPEPIDPAHLPDVLEGLAQRAGASLPVTLRSKQRFAASTDEAAIRAACH